MVSLLVVHGNRIAVVGNADRGVVIPGVDGLITQSPNVVLTITAADCLPLVLFDPVTKTLGLVHAGRRGLAARVIAAAIEQLRQMFDVNPKNLRIGIAPSIGPCHYDVAQADADVFREYQSAVEETDGKFFLDLRTVALQQCSMSGVPSEHTEFDSRCTFEQNEFFSARRDQKSPVDVMLIYCRITA